MLEVREARYFIAVAEELHFGRAAARLHMSQPPLSQAVQALERRLGVRLLQRTTRAVSLTSAGSVLLEQCRMVVGAAETAESATIAAALGQAGEVRIGAVGMAFVDPLPAILERFAAGHPQVSVRVRELDTRDAVLALRRHEIDVALAPQSATPPDFRRTILGVHRFVLAVPTPWAEDIDRSPVSLATVAELPWIWIPREVSPDYHDQVVACCRAAGFSPEARHTTRSIVSQLAMVSCGIGVAMVPENALLQLSTAGRDAIRIVEFLETRTIELAAIAHRTATPLVEALLDSAAVGHRIG